MAEQTKGKKVKPNDTVEIIWVGSKFHKAGEKSTVHKSQAEKLINDGKAYYEGQEPKAKPGKKNKDIQL